MQKVCRFFLRMQNSREFCYCDAILWVNINSGLECSRFHGSACAPMRTEIRRQYSVSFCRTNSAILRHPYPFYGVERSSLLGWSFYDHGLRPVNLDRASVVVFTRSQSCRLNCIGSVYRLCRDLLLKNYRAAILSSLEVNVMHSNLEA